MAHEKQCESCKGYNPKSGLCTIKWEQPTFDGTNCNQNRDVHTTINADINKQESDNEPEYITETEIIDNEPQDTPYSLKKILLPSLVGIILIVAAFYGYTVIKHDAEEEARENLVWEARKQLERLVNDKTVGYMRLQSVEYKDHTLMLGYQVNVPWYSNIVFVDSIIPNEFSSLMAIAPDRWSIISKYLNEAKVDIGLTFINFPELPVKNITHEHLSEIIHDQDLMSQALYYFEQKKKGEILDYARYHFQNDPYLKVEGVTVNKDQVTLTLLYNDLEYRMGESYLDHDQINAHFTDAVGDMGSILDGMWTICSRTGKGIAIIYKGAKRSKTERVEWNAKETIDLYKKYGSSIWINPRRTNRVTTTIVREKAK